MHIGASIALIMAVVTLCGAYLWKTFYPTAPFDIFAATLAAIFAAYIGKRLIQKQEQFQEKDGNGE